jgi:hypothetical protein
VSVDLESAAVLSSARCTSSLCNSPDVELTDSVEVSSLMVEESGWLAHGIVQFSYCVHGRCRTCGRVFEAATRQIPIQFPEITCPKCDRTEHLKYQVQGITKTLEGYEFTVNLKCSGCESTKSLRRILSGLLNMISIEVGLTGISIKKSSAK